LVGPNGEQVGIVRVEDALRLAAEADLDLVEVAPMAKPPVAKLMDYGKYKYQQSKKQQEARRRQTTIQVKEVKVRPKIEEHDMDFKLKHIRRFLADRDKVKVTIRFRGREFSRQDLGTDVLNRLALELEDIAKVESQPKMDGRQMVMILRAS